MSRCDACYSIITKKDSVCYVCGQKVPHYSSVASTRKRLSLFSNILFLISLGFTGFSFFSDHKLPLPYSLAVSCTLLALKLVADRYASQAEERTSPSAPRRSPL
ncbi:MAG TPA: hypothetical protein VLW25_00305 [Bryobacteraceae bacterium]|nr:hypothetical protein [Bryobacteraceae bacterium]